MAKYGIIYIIQNEFHPSDVYKVGYTTNSINERVDELNRETSNPGKFKVCGYFPVTDVTEAEKLCHQHLEQTGFAKRNLLIHESPLIDALFLLVSKSDEVTTT